MMPHHLRLSTMLYDQHNMPLPSVFYRYEFAIRTAACTGGMLIQEIGRDILKLMSRQKESFR
jgi:hypothetical protein